MGSSQVSYMTAGKAQEGSRCPSCAKNVRAGETVGVCKACGVVRHQGCWVGKTECCAFSEGPLRHTTSADAANVLTITQEELDQAVPLPPRFPVHAPIFDPRALPPPPTNRMAVVAFILALAGIPLFGLITGLVAMVLGCLALGALQGGNQRGMVLAIIAVVLGAVDVIAWLLLLFYVYNNPVALGPLGCAWPQVPMSY